MNQPATLKAQSGTEVKVNESVLHHSGRGWKFVWLFGTFDSLHWV